jgi:hypothetical protein
MREGWHNALLVTGLAREEHLVVRRRFFDLSSHQPKKGYVRRAQDTTHLPPALLEEGREVLGHSADLYVVLLDLRLVRDLHA